MAEPALFFIPDISGFTRFVTRTEVQHANHIISELLEVIVESNRLGLKLSEIEGDAVLFYRVGPPPLLTDLLSQVRHTFIDFHRFLKVIDQDRVCQCGACSAASGLTLKFIVHYGALDEVRVRSFLKLMGRDVILAHRLLKNAVPGNEYALLTEDYLDSRPRRHEPPAAATPSWAHLHPHVDRLSAFGAVASRYVPLAPLRSEVPEPLERSPLDVSATKGSITVHVDAPVVLVHEAVTDFEHRLQWTPGLRDSIAASPINRVGAAHTCVFDSSEVHLVTLDHQVTRRGFHYAESAEVAGIAVVSDVRMRDVDGGTSLTVSLILGGGDGGRGPRRSLRMLRARFLLWLYRRGLAKAVRSLKAYCEALHREDSDPKRHPPAVGSEA